ncbi:MAG TPA: ADOP family duplicated permease [Terriglobales bacterium]|nr:ADOP family duplicated permease [Terriglobales bacterium]
MPSRRRLREELEAHLEALAQRYRAQGMGEAEARRAARLKLGGADQIEEAWGDERRFGWLEDLRRDLILGARALRRAPGFTAVVVLSLALGIGANTAIFSLLDAALLQKLPVRAPDELALLYWHAQRWPRGLDQSGTGSPPTSDDGSFSLAYATYLQLRDHSGIAMQNIFAFSPLGVGTPSTALEVDGRTSLARASLVTGGFFPGLGLAAYRGRLVGAHDEVAGASPVVVLSFDYWSAHFAANPELIGKAVTINGSAATVVGIAPPQFQGVVQGAAVDAWISLSPTNPASLAPWGFTPPAGSIFTATSYWWLQVMGRRRPGVSLAQAQAQLGPQFEQSAVAALHREPKGDSLPQLGVMSGAQGINQFASDHGQDLWVMMSVAGLLLLLACVNVAALLLARASARRQEIGVRLALGARRWRLIRQLLTESVLLAGLGGAFGAAIAPLGVRLLLTLLGGAGGPLPVAAGVDGWVVAFALGVSLLTGLLFGLAPALRSTRQGVCAPLQPGRAGAVRVRLRGDKMLAVVQVALSLVLLVGAGLFLRTLRMFEVAPLGFNPNHLLVFGLDGAEAGYRGAGLSGLYERVHQAIGAVPGVSAVTESRLRLLDGWIGSGSLHVPGVTLDAANTHTLENSAGPGFLAAFGMRLLAGRDFNDADLRSSNNVVIINQSLARQLFGTGMPLGRQLGPGLEPGGRLYTVIGVAQDARYGSLRGPMPPTLFWPYTQADTKLGTLTFQVRFRTTADAVLPGIRQALQRIDPALAMSDPKLETEVAGGRLARQQMFAQLSSFFGLLGLLLAAIGIKGTMAYAVARRSAEIGIRMALGARRGQVLGAVLRETLAVTLGGIAAGAVAALLAARLVATKLYGVKPNDPATLLGAALLLLAVAALAGLWPARHAARTDPMRALRSE